MSELHLGHKFIKLKKKVEEIMKIENTIKIIKEIHPNDIIFLKVGQFYHCYGKDAVFRFSN